MPWQPAAIVHVDIELWATGYLRDALEDYEDESDDEVYLSNKIPTARRPRMVIVRRDGGVPQGTFDVPRVNFGVWAATEQEVSDLTLLVAALLSAAPDGDPVTHAQMVGGPISIDDPSEQPRRSMTFEFRTRGAQA